MKCSWCSSNDTNMNVQIIVVKNRRIMVWSVLCVVLFLHAGRADAGNSPHWGRSLRTGVQSSSTTITTSSDPSTSPTSSASNDDHSSTSTSGSIAVQGHHAHHRHDHTGSDSRRSMWSVDPSNLISLMVTHGGLLVDESTMRNLGVLSKVCHSEQVSLNVVEKQLLVENFSVRIPGEDDALHVGRVFLQWDSYLQPCIDIEVTNVTVVIDFTDLTMSETNWDELKRHGFPPKVPEPTEKPFFRIGGIVLKGDIFASIQSRPLQKEIAVFKLDMGSFEDLYQQIRQLSYDNYMEYGRLGCTPEEIITLLRTYFATKSKQLMVPRDHRDRPGESYHGEEVDSSSLQRKGNSDPPLISMETRMEVPQDARVVKRKVDDALISIFGKGTTQHRTKKQRLHNRHSKRNGRHHHQHLRSKASVMDGLQIPLLKDDSFRPRRQRGGKGILRRVVHGITRQLGRFLVRFFDAFLRVLAFTMFRRDAEGSRTATSGGRRRCSSSSSSSSSTTVHEDGAASFVSSFGYFGLSTAGTTK